MKFALLLLFLAGTPPPEDVATWLGRLEAPRAEARHQAQRWLAAHLERADFAEAAQFARKGGEELRLRLAQAVAADDARLDMTMLFLTDPAPEVAAVGQAAFTEMVVRWSTTAELPPLRAGMIPEPWREREGGRMALDATGGSLAEVIEHFDRVGGGPAPVILDPVLERRSPIGGAARAAETVEGSWHEVLAGLMSVHRVAFEVHGWRRDGEDVELGARPFVRVYVRGERDPLSARDRLVEWCRGLMREADPRGNRACARALATTGWPAALAWMEQRWLERNDAAALEGLLCAASRGRIVPTLATPQRIRVLLDAADARLAAGEAGATAFVERLAQALIALGPRDARGAPLAETILAGFDRSELAAARWLRLVALEGAGDRRGVVAQAAAAEVARGESPELVLQALRVLASLGPTPAAQSVRMKADSAARLLAFGAREGRLDEVGRLLISGGVPRPADFDPGAESGVRPLAMIWALLGGAPERARAELVERIASMNTPELDALAIDVARWAGLGRGEALRRWIDETSGATSDPARSARLARLALRAGLMTPEGQRAALDRLTEGARSPEDLEDLGALAADPAIGWRAREAIADLMTAGSDPEVVLATAARAVRALRAARRDTEESAFLAKLRREALRAGPEWVERFAGPEWPPEPARSPRVLSHLDRRLPEGLRAP